MLSERNPPKSGPVAPAASRARYGLLVHGVIGCLVLALNIWSLTLVSGGPGPEALQWLERLGMIELVLLLIGVVVFIVNVVLFLIWQYRAAAAIEGRDDIVSPSISPGWQVGWWFIPIANIVMPVLAMGQLYRASVGGAGPSWRKHPFPGAVLGWWLLWLVGVSIGRYATRKFDAAQTAADYVQAYWTYIAGGILELMALALILQIIRDITQGQAKWPQRPAVAAPVPERVEPA